MKKIKSYFAGANTGEGFRNFFDYIGDEEKEGYSFVLKGGPGTGKSTFMKKIGEFFAGKGEAVELFYCSSDIDSLDGVRLSDRNISVVDGTAPHVTEAKIPAVTDKIVNIGAYISDDVAGLKSEIKTLLDEKKFLFDMSYAYIHIASDVMKLNLEITDDKNFDAESAADKLVEAAKIENCSNKPRERKLFLSTITENGDYCFEEQNDYDVVYYVKENESGSAKTMNALREKLLAMGKEITVFPNVLCPEIIDFIEVGEKNLLFKREANNVSDRPEIRNLLNFNKETEKTIFGKLKEILAKIKILHRNVEALYVKNMDFDGLNELTLKTIKEIESKLKN